MCWKNNFEAGNNVGWGGRCVRGGAVVLSGCFGRSGWEWVAGLIALVRSRHCGRRGSVWFNLNLKFEFEKFEIDLRSVSINSSAKLLLLHQFVVRHWQYEPVAFASSLRVLEPLEGWVWTAGTLHRGFGRILPRTQFSIFWVWEIWVEILAKNLRFSVEIPTQISVNSEKASKNLFCVHIRPCDSEISLKKARFFLSWVHIRIGLTERKKISFSLACLVCMTKQKKSASSHDFFFCPKSPKWS